MMRLWLGVIVAALLVIALVAFARGREHHRGDDVGAMAGASRVAAVSVVT
jgi:hypothetical protein